VCTLCSERISLYVCYKSVLRFSAGLFVWPVSFDEQKVGATFAGTSGVFTVAALDLGLWVFVCLDCFPSPSRAEGAAVTVTLC
jgi:hypothetical protein